MPERLRCFAAVVPSGPLADRLDALRWALGSTEVGRLAPHITLVPPTNVAVADLPATLSHLRTVARARVPFTIALGPVRVFDRAEPVVYLAVDDSTGTLAELAAACASARFAPAGPVDRHRFVPHLTLVNRAAPSAAEGAVAALGALRDELTVGSVTLFRRATSPGARRWVPLAEYRLGEPVVRGRGGIAVELSWSRVVDPDAAELLAAPDPASDPGKADPGKAGPGKAEPSEARPEGARAEGARAEGARAEEGEPFALSGRVEDRPVVVARGRLAAAALLVEQLVVRSGHEREGIGSRALEELERVADGRPVRFVHPPAPLAAFLRGRGYVEVAPAPPDGFELARYP